MYHLFIWYLLEYSLPIKLCVTATGLLLVKINKYITQVTVGISLKSCIKLPIIIPVYKMIEKQFKCLSQLSRAQTDIFKVFLLFNQQSKTQRLFIYSHK